MKGSRMATSVDFRIFLNRELLNKFSVSQTQQMMWPMFLLLQHKWQVLMGWAFSMSMSMR